jgi:hypothetical protein
MSENVFLLQYFIIEQMDTTNLILEPLRTSSGEQRISRTNWRVVLMKQFFLSKFSYLCFTVSLTLQQFKASIRIPKAVVSLITKSNEDNNYTRDEKAL